MIHVDWPAAFITFAAIAAQLDAVFFRVAFRAKRLHRVQAKFIPISAMRFDMIDGCRRHDDATASAHPAQRLDLQLIGSPFAPARERIPVAPGARADLIHGQRRILRRLAAIVLPERGIARGVDKIPFAVLLCEHRIQDQPRR